MNLLNQESGWRVQLLTIDNTDLNVQYVLGDVPTGKTVDMIVNYFGKSRLNGKKIIGITRVNVTESAGALVFFGSSGDISELQAPVKSAGLETAELLVGGADTELSLAVQGVDGEGDMDWYLFITTKLY